MRRTVFATLAPLAAFALAACNPMENLSEAEDQIDRFHTHYDFGEFQDMYQMTSPAFRKASSPEDFKKLADVITARLGSIKSTERVNFNVNTTPAGTQTIITMQTIFEQGNGSEVFTFAGNGEDMKIQGWTVNSDRLMVTAEDLEAIDSAGKQPPVAVMSAPR